MRGLIILLAGLLIPLQAWAQGQPLSVSTHVSLSGDNNNTCAANAPCRSFTAAYAKTVANGIIFCNEPGNYGELQNITKAITIDCMGGPAIVSSGLISINAGANDLVILKGLTVDGSFIAGTFAAITFTSGAGLILENVTVQKFTTGAGLGLDFKPSTAATLTM